ncbi:MAG: hypothetical protein AAF616_06815 [Bacteroidota bacterium]
MLRLLVFCLIYITAIYGFAQNGEFSFGARQAGLAGAAVTLGDAYSLFNNVGGLGRLQQHTIFAGYQNRFNINEFTSVGGGGIFHHDLGNAGLGYYKFGDAAFSEQKAHVAFGNQIQMVSLGLGVDLIQYNFEFLGSQRAVALQFGGIAHISRQFVFGAHIFNLNQADLKSDLGEKIPTVMKGGFSYRPNEELMLNIEIEKDLGFTEIFKAGIEYRIIEKVFVRTGIRTQPFQGAFGLGFYTKRFLLDYAFSSDAQLGGTHDLSVTYSFAK